VSDLKFKVGQTVIATAVHDYRYHLTEGKQYVVTKFEDRQPDQNFTWPAYVTVIGDWGKPVTCHTHRFRPLEDA
jgi:hypothetical protein